jgi:hypothetical protein
MPGLVFRLTEENPIPFVQDRSPIHTTYLVQTWFEEEGFEFELGEFDVLSSFQKEFN